MRSFFLVLFVCTANLQAHAQTERYIRHNHLRSSAEYAHHLGQYDVAVEQYDSALALVPWVASEYFDAVMASLHARRKDHAIELLLQGAEHGFDPIHWSDSILHTFLNGKDAEKYWEQRPRRDSLYLGSVDTLFVAQVIQMVDADQAVRTSSSDAATMALQDSIHFERMLAICAERGYPTWRNLGAKDGYWWLLLWHHRGANEYPHSAQWKRMLPHIEKAIAVGDLDPAYLSMFDDVVANELGRPMRFGTLLGYFQGLPEHLSFVDRRTLDRNRASLGLAPFEWWAEELGIDLSTIRFADP